MRWFKHFTNARRDPVLLFIKHEMGFAGVGMYWALVEAISEQYKANGNPEIETDFSSWRDLTGIPPQSLRRLVETMAKVYEKLGKSSKFSWSLVEKSMKIRFEKVKDIRDNHTTNLQATCKQEEEVEKEERKEISNIKPLCSVLCSAEKNQELIFKLIEETEFGEYVTKTEAHERIIIALSEIFKKNGFNVKRELKVLNVKVDRNGFIDLKVERDGFIVLIELDSVLRKKSLVKLQKESADMKIEFIYTENIPKNYNNTNGIWFLGRQLFVNKNKESISRDTPYSDSFLCFWDMYPRKSAKGYAWESWQRIGRSKTATVPEIMSKLQMQLNAGMFSLDDPSKIPHPSTWLNQRRWEDEVKNKANSGGYFLGEGAAV